jgi:hypothetical protein
LPRFLGAFRVHAHQKTTVDHNVGRAECDRLRTRVHGRSLPIEEIGRRLRPYLIRHMLADARYRILNSFSFKRVAIRTMQIDPGLESVLPPPEVTAAEARQPALASPLTPTTDSLAEGSDPSR